MNLMRSREVLKSIRRGEWKKEDLIKWAQDKTRELDVAFTNTKLPDKPDEQKLKQLLMNCLEIHYGSLEKAINIPGKEERLLRDIAYLIKDYL